VADVGHRPKKSQTLSTAKYLLFAGAEHKADPSDAQNRRDLRMTLLRVFQQPVQPRRELPAYCPASRTQRRLHVAVLCYYHFSPEFLPEGAS
jgi:hypothetical protein